MNKHIVLLTIFGFYCTILSAQVPLVFDQAPSNYQLFQRDVNTNKALIPISGKIGNGKAYSKIGFFLLSEKGQTDSVVLLLNGRTTFNQNISLPAGKANHLLNIYAYDPTSQQWDWASSVDKLLAGDVYIIDGQSNATANASPNMQDVVEYTRGWHPNFGWGRLNLSFPGEWGARLAHDVSDETGIPIAIINNASTADQIKDFVKNTANPSQGNYGKLLARFDAAGAPRKARAAFWFHGEADAWETSQADYMNSFSKIKASWKIDFGIEHAFLYQMRFNSCNSPKPIILEAQRQIALTDNEVDVMSTNNADHDNCHFYYEKGYKVLGDRMAAVVLHRLYGGAAYDIFSPGLVKIEKTGVQQVRISSKNASALMIIGTPWTDFRAEPSGQLARSGHIDGTSIVLEMPLPLDSVTGLSYLGHKGAAANWITNPSGVGLLSFYNQAILIMPDTSKQDTVPTNNPQGVDLQLQLTASDTLPGTWKTTDLTLKLSNKGNITATGIEVSFMEQSTAAVFDKMALVSYDVPKDNYFDFWNGIWRVPSLAANATYTLHYRIFTKTTAPLHIFGQVTKQNEVDLDSKPNNNQLKIPLEDDEALVLLNWDHLLKKGNAPPAFSTDELENLLVFPNPASQFFQIKVESLQKQQATIELTQVNGTLVKTLYSGEVNTPTLQFALEGIDSGLYFVKIKAEHQRVTVQKLVVERNR